MSCSSWSRPTRGPTLFFFAFLLFAFALFVQSSAQVFYSIDGVPECAEVAQMWYDGYWKAVEGITGTIQEWPDGDMTGKIVLMRGFHAPHEKRLREAQALGAAAVLLIREISFPPGFGMYSVDGSDRKRINIPVFEAGYGGKFDPSRRKIATTATSPAFISPTTTCNYNPKIQLNKLTSGDVITIVPMENRHKKALDTPFQLILSILLSIWEMAIVSLGIYRIHQLIAFDRDARILAAAPVCCALEVVGALLRLIYTCVDPFYTWRILPDPAAQSGISISFPFSFAAGVLLTFYWAEMLTKSRMKVQPFIVSYRPAAIATVVFLFLLEFVSICLRANSERIPTVVSRMELASSLIYAIVSVVLATCYIICAVGIWKRIQLVPGAYRSKSGGGSASGSAGGGESGSFDSAVSSVEDGDGPSTPTTPRKPRRFKLRNMWKRHKIKSVNRMTVRMVSSAAGYILFIISCIFFAVWYAWPWGRMLPLNLTFIAHNWSATMQILATRPRKSHSSHSSSLDKYGSSAFEANTYSQPSNDVAFTHAAASSTV